MNIKSTEAISPKKSSLKNAIFGFILLVFWYMLAITTVSLVALNLFELLGEQAAGLPVVLIVVTIAICIEAIRRRRGVSDLLAYGIFPISCVAFIFYGLLLVGFGSLYAAPILVLYGICVAYMLRSNSHKINVPYSVGHFPKIDQKVDKEMFKVAQFGLK